MLEVDRSLLLYGTDEPAGARRTLQAGRLSAELEDGALRYIRWNGFELLRAIAFVLRDTRWGTYAPDLDGLVVDARADRFEVGYRGHVSGPEGDFDYSASIIGEAGGRLRFSAEGRSPAGLRTNRAGFVVLHPLEGAVGRPLTIRHGDGATEETVFPILVRPDQPATEIAGLRHEAAPGLSVEIAFSGEVFEMEDHRNWTDASFKTYVRPLVRGFPYRIEPGAVLSQSVEVVVKGRAPAVARSGDTVALEWGGDDAGRMPAIGLYLDGAASEPPNAAEMIADLKPSYLQARIDLRRPDWADQLARAAGLARRCGCALHLDAVIAGVAPSDELEALARRLPALGSPDALFVVPARDLRSRPSGSTPPGEADAAEVLAAARAAFPGVRLVGGMPVGFPELNRNRPPTGIDMVTHATQAIVHAADDRSVMETLEALPHVIATTRSFAGSVAYRLGPATIGMLPSASASEPAKGPASRRTALAARDPRQRGLFAAAFLVGLIAATRGIDALTPAAPFGDVGLLDGDGSARPVAMVFAGAAALAGAPRLSASPGEARRLAVVAARTPQGPCLWLANLTGEPIDVVPSGPPLRQARIVDAARLASGRTDPDIVEPLGSKGLRLDAFAVARLT